MGIFFQRKRPSIPANARFKITQNGRDKLMEFDSDPKSRVLSALETRGTCDLDEISMQSGLNRGEVERLIPRLVPHYVQYVNSSEQGE